MDIGLPGAPGAPVLNAARAAASRRNGAPGPVGEKGPQPLPSPGAKSRGPKTPEGKARSARNALKHGLRAEKFVLLHDEDAKQFEAMADALADDLAPVGALQSVLARRLMVAAWRLERADRIERELFALHAERSEGGRGRLGLALVRDGNGRHGRVGERGPNPFPALTPRVRHAPALPRLGHGRAVARTAGAQGAAGGGQAREMSEAEPDLPAPTEEEIPIEPEAGGNPGETAPEPHAADQPGCSSACPAPTSHAPTHACIQARQATQTCATMRHLCATHAPPSAGASVDGVSINRLEGASRRDVPGRQAALAVQDVRGIVRPTAGAAGITPGTRETGNATDD
jgi:hypothetical protein